MKIGDKVYFHLLRGHLCGGDLTRCECRYPFGSIGPDGWPGATVSRVATITGILADGQLDLDVELSSEDWSYPFKPGQEPPDHMGFVRNQQAYRATTNPPEMSTWTPIE